MFYCISTLLLPWIFTLDMNGGGSHGMHAASPHANQPVPLVPIGQPLAFTMHQGPYTDSLRVF